MWQLTAPLLAVQNTLVQTLAQASPVPMAPPTKPWWQILLENGLALTLLFIFLVAVVGVIFRLRRKDKCLKLLSGHHVSYLDTAGRSVWGDLVVYSQGLELRFDVPHTTRQGLNKSSALIYEKELANCLAVCRLDGALTEDERRRRQRQIRHSFRPGLMRRTIRWMRNILNTLRDAFSKAMSAILGQLARARPGSSVLATQQAQVDEIGQTLLGAAGNAYEPLLEAHIGKPVVLRIASTIEPTQQPVELPGYLVDYSDRFIAVFNVEHEPIERIELELTESVEQAGIKAELRDDEAVITCTGPEALVVARAGMDETSCELAVPLLPGCAVSLSRQSGQAVKLTLQRTHRLDVVCPRAIASVYFGGESEAVSPRSWRGSRRGARRRRPSPWLGRLNGRWNGRRPNGGDRREPALGGGAKRNALWFPPALFPHTSSLTSQASHLKPHISSLTPQASSLTPHTSRPSN